MATEHEIGGGEQVRLCADGKVDVHRGWGEASSNRYHPTSGWGSWSNVEIPASAGDADTPGDSREGYHSNSIELESAKPMEDAEGMWHTVFESADDVWGERMKFAESPKTTWDKISEPAESPRISWDKICELPESPKTFWDKIPEPAGGGWDDLYDPDCKTEETPDTEIGLKCSGLANLGNTCFMNSVLQCLTYTVPFANRMLTSRHRIACKAQDFCAMCAMENHIKVVLVASGNTVSPAFLARNLDQISMSFVPGQQQDAHEFLLFLLEGMQQQCRTERVGQSPITKPDIVSELFMGQMKSNVKCKSCLHCSESVEPFLGLNLEIENCNSVQEGLSNFLAVEDLQEDDKVSCSHCKQIVKRSKQLSFSKSPQILIVQLKRYKASEFFPTKIERNIKYEMSLDLAPYVKQGDSGVPIKELDWNYGLYGVLVHSGWSTSSGHYYCFVQTSPGVWHCMNDSLVTRVSERTVLLQEAYILFYIRNGSNEELQINNLQTVGDNLEQAENVHNPVPQEIVNPYPNFSPIKDDLANDKCSVLNFDSKESSEPLGSSSQEQAYMEPNVHVVSSQVKSPDISKQITDNNELCNENEISSQMTQPAHQWVPSSKSPLAPSKGITYERREKQSPSINKAVLEHEETKPFPAKMIPSSSQRKSSSLAPIVVPNQPAFDSFENGSQHSYLRLLNKMPSSRRQALSSVLSDQGSIKQNGLKSTTVKDKVKPVNNQLQAGMGRATSRLLQKEEHQGSKGKPGIREKPWADDHSFIDSRKLQRVGGKRVLAAFSSGVR